MKLLLTMGLIVSLAACSGATTGGADAGAKGDAGNKKKRPTSTGAKGTGDRGGAGATRPTAGTSTTTTSSKTTTTTAKTPVAGDNPCTDATLEGVAECDGDTNIYFCSGGALYSLDCNAYMTSSEGGSFTSGSCFETTTTVDCLGCDVYDDGSTLCCDAAGTICCPDQGECFDPG